MGGTGSLVNAAGAEGVFVTWALALLDTFLGDGGASFGAWISNQASSCVRVPGFLFLMGSGSGSTESKLSSDGDLLSTRRGNISTVSTTEYSYLLRRAFFVFILAPVSGIWATVPEAPGGTALPPRTDTCSENMARAAIRVSTS